MKITAAFALDDERDQDIIGWLKKQPNKSQAIRAAIRLSMGNGLTLADIRQDIAELRQLIEGGHETANLRARSD